MSSWAAIAAIQEPSLVHVLREDDPAPEAGVVTCHVESRAVLEDDGQGCVQDGVGLDRRRRLEER